MKTARAFYDTPDAAAMDPSEDQSSRLVAAMAFETGSTFLVGHKARSLDWVPRVGTKAGAVVCFNHEIKHAERTRTLASRVDEFYEGVEVEVDRKWICG